LWANSGWKRVGMHEVADPQEVKKLYRKATLLCHPDRIHASDDPEKAYIANMCFGAITEAWNSFKVRLNI
jgi:curved DNA-binding protein CbpA